jgi:hypothetical protein
MSGRSFLTGSGVEKYSDLQYPQAMHQHLLIGAGLSSIH